MDFLPARSVVGLDATLTPPVDVLDACRSFLQMFGERHRLRTFDELKLELRAEVVIRLPRGRHFAYCQIEVCFERGGGKFRLHVSRCSGDGLAFGCLHVLIREHLEKTFFPDMDVEQKKTVTEGPGVADRNNLQRELAPLIDMLIYSHNRRQESEACMALASMVDANPLCTGSVYNAIVEEGAVEKLVDFVDRGTLDVSYPSRILLRAFDGL